MKRQGMYSLRWGLCLFFLASFILPRYFPVRAAPNNLPDPPADQVAVKLRHNVAIATILARYSASLLGTVSENNLYFLKLPAGQTAAHVLPALNADADLVYAEPNYYTGDAPNGQVILFTAHMAPAAGVILFTAHGQGTPAPPADPWAWEKTHLAAAQRVSRGQNVIVAVLDTGLAPDHSLLNASLIAGYDFVGMRQDIYDTGNGIDDDGDGQVDESVGHGTHVAGIIVTVAPGVQVMPIRVLNSDGAGTYWEVAEGIRYAVDHGARVVNLSLSAPRLTPSLAAALDYAAAHGVIVVAAAGVGNGPNYPAAHPNPMDVIGVGATDRSDALAWFSGGLPSDSDVYAPGVDIYSAFPYNGYGLGSGTSMAAPIVAAEAALLLSRYPDWTPTQVMERVIQRTTPLPGLSAGRVDLAAAVSTSLELRYAVVDPGSPGDNQIKPRLQLINHTSEDIPWNELTIRYWLTADGEQQQEFNCDYTEIRCGNLLASFTSLPADSPQRTSLSDAYLEIGFSGSAGILAAGSSASFAVRIHKVDWSNYNETNDYSYNAVAVSPTASPQISIYRHGNLAWGSPPGAITIIPPVTPTALPAPTGTPMGAVALKVQYRDGSGSPTNNEIKPHLQIINTGSSGVPLSAITVRYWFTSDGSQAQSAACDYAMLGCGKITRGFVGLNPARPTADTCLVVAFADSGILLPGASTGEIQLRLNKSDWSDYNEVNDFSFVAAQTSYADWTRVTVYVNDFLVWGVEP